MRLVNRPKMFVVEVDGEMIMWRPFDSIHDAKNFMGVCQLETGKTCIIVDIVTGEYHF